MTDATDLVEIAHLRLRLEEAEETIRAIRNGAVDAFVVEVPSGARVYTLETADRPYRLLVEEMQQGAITLSDTGSIAYCNRRFADLVGRSPEKLMGIKFSDFVPVEAQGFYEKLLQQGRLSCSQGETHLRKSDATLVPVFLTLNALPADTGAAIGLLVTDLTTQHHHEELNALLEALKEADQRKNEFLAMLGHELRNPLAPIASAVQLLGLQRSSENQIQKQARAIIERQLARLQKLIDDLLEVSRITSGRVHLRRELVAANSIVQLATESVRHIIQQGRHEFTVSVPMEPIWLHVDPARLEQVLVNLLANAVKYTDEGGHIELDVSTESLGINGEWMPPHPTEDGATDSGDQNATFAVFRVRDTGVGIAPTLLPHIFDLFTQAERSLDRSQGGLGIGLALVQRLTELHGGTVDAISELGRGSEFIVRIPLAKSVVIAHVSPIADSGLQITPSLRVLIVDDNVDAALTIGMLLTALGHTIRTTYDGPTALEAALCFRPQAILLDIGLPGMNGYMVAEQLRQQPLLKNVVVIALTGYGQDVDRHRSREAGFDHHLVKPADFASLQEILSTVPLESPHHAEETAGTNATVDV